jgi:hypothetical protein
MTTRDDQAAGAAMKLLAIAEAIKAEAGVTRHHVLTDPDRAVDGIVLYGWSFPKRGIIHAPAGRTERELYSLAHECAHVALRHDHRKPLWRREYEAELWAQDALRRHGVAPHGYDLANACENVLCEIDAAVESGKFGRPKRLAAEAAEWSGWNLVLEWKER